MCEEADSRYEVLVLLIEIQQINITLKHFKTKNLNMFIINLITIIIHKITKQRVYRIILAKTFIRISNLKMHSWAELFFSLIQ